VCFFYRLLFFSETSLRKKTNLATLLYKTSEDAKKLICRKECEMDYIRMEIVPLLRNGRENIARLKVYIYLSTVVYFLQEVELLIL
jgi:hypothetical protein